MRIANKILFFYCLVFALFLTISGILTSSSIQQLSLQLIFLPITAYFTFTLIKHLLQKKPNQETSKASFRNKTTLFILFIFIALLLISSLNVIKKKSIQAQNVMIPQPTNTYISPSPTPTPKKEEKMYIVVKTDEENTKVNIRQSASASAKVLEKTTANQKYAFIMEENDWYKIILKDGSFGYIHKDFSSIVTDL